MYEKVEARVGSMKDLGPDESLRFIVTVKNPSREVSGSDLHFRYITLWGV